MGVRVDDDGLVREAAEALDRLRIAVGVLVVRVDLEAVAVRLGADRLGLLTGDPGLPRRAAAGAVVQRAGEAHVLAHALAAMVDLDVRRAAVDAGVVDEALDRRDGRLAAADLVVADQHAAVAAVADEGRHAVGIGGRRLAALEQGHVGLRDDRVAEALRQRELAGRVGDQRAVADLAGRRGLCGAGAEQPGDAAGEHDAEAGGGAVEHRAAREAGVGVLTGVDRGHARHRSGRSPARR